MRKFLNLVLAGVFTLLVAAPVVAVTTSTQASAGPSCEASFLGIPPWYRGMTNDDCTIMSPNTNNDPKALSQFIWRIVLNIIQMALVIVAYVAIFFILWGGFLFMTGGSNSAQIEKARKSILNAVIGLVIAMGAIAITNFIFNIIGSAATTANGLPTLSGEELLRNGLNIVYFIAGTIAVITIVIGGILYTTSAGDSGKVTKAKNMITYSIVGLVVVLAAFAITNFIIGRFS